MGDETQRAAGLVEVIRLNEASEVAEMAALLRRAGVAAVPDIHLGRVLRLRVLVPEVDVPIAEGVLDAIVHRPEGDASPEEIERALADGPEPPPAPRAAAAWHRPRLLLFLFAVAAVLARLAWLLADR